MRCVVLSLALLFGALGQPAVAQVGVGAQQLEKQVKRNRTRIRLVGFGVVAVGAIAVWSLVQSSGRQQQS